MPVAFRSLLVIVEGTEVAIDQLGELAADLSVAAEDVEVKLVVFQTAQGEGEIDLDVADSSTKSGWPPLASAGSGVPSASAASSSAFDLLT